MADFADEREFETAQRMTSPLDDMQMATFSPDSRPAPPLVPRLITDRSPPYSMGYSVGMDGQLIVEEGYNNEWGVQESPSPFTPRQNLVSNFSPSVFFDISPSEHQRQPQMNKAQVVINDLVLDERDPNPVQPTMRLVRI
jgi:hypothetical protein